MFNVWFTFMLDGIIDYAFMLPSGMALDRHLCPTHLRAQGTFEFSHLCWQTNLKKEVKIRKILWIYLKIKWHTYVTKVKKAGFQKPSKKLNLPKILTTRKTNRLRFLDFGCIMSNVLTNAWCFLRTCRFRLFWKVNFWPHTEHKNSPFAWIFWNRTERKKFWLNAHI